MILASASPASVVLTLAAAAAYAVPAAAATQLSERAARIALLAAWLLHGAVLAWGLLGEAPRFGFAPALSVTAWLVLTVYAVERQLFPQLQARWALAGLGAIALLLALAFPGAPLQVSASPWLPLHWALGIASYGLFAAAVVHAWLMTRAERQFRQDRALRFDVPAQLLVLGRIGLVDPAAQDRDCSPSGGQRAPMSRRVDPTGQSADNGEPRLSQITAELFRDGTALRRRSARSDNRDSISIGGIQPAGKIEQRGRIGDLFESIRVLSFHAGEYGDPALMNLFDLLLDLRRGAKIHSARNGVGQGRAASTFP